MTTETGVISIVLSLNKAHILKACDLSLRDTGVLDKMKARQDEG